jgi:hypothetical protein
MPDEYDAFGRKKDETGLGDLGWGASGDKPVKPSVSAGSTPTPTPTPTQATPPPRQFQTVIPVSSGLIRPRRNPGIVFVQLAVLAAIVGAIALAVMSGSSANNTARKTLDGFKSLTDPSGGTTTTDEGDGTVPKQVKSASFFTPKGLRAGLKILAKEQPGKISNYSMRKDRIDIQVIRGHKNHIVELRAGAEVPQEFSVSTASSSLDTLSYEELNVTAPARLMKAADARLNASPKQVDYFVAQKFTGTLQWGIYYKNGKIAQGDSRGRFTRRLS